MKPRVLLANEPRSYRQAIAAVLRDLRPGVEFGETEPEDLDRHVVRRAPQLVICSRATPTVRSAAPSWVELYKDHGSLSPVSTRREQSTVEEMELSDLLLIVDRAVVLLYFQGLFSGRY